MFHSNFQSVSFENSLFAARKINKWVEKITRKKIKDLITPDIFNSDIQLVFVNAIYFKGDWAEKFDTIQIQTLFLYVYARALCFGIASVSKYQQRRIS
jgi:serine protease inhibitor